MFTTEAYRGGAATKTTGHGDTGTRRTYESLQPVKNLTLSITKSTERRAEA